MSVRRLAIDQPDSFAFTADNMAWAKSEIAKYPEGRQLSAVIALLWRAQYQAGGWLPQKAIEHVATVLGVPNIRVLEIATFYTMFNLDRVGRYHVQLCGTTPCMLRGSEDIKAVCRKKIGEQNAVTSDGNFSWVEVECLGACVNAPMVQINYDFYEDLTPDSFTRILDEMAAGRMPKPGPQIDRQFAAPVGGPTTLTDSALYQGSANAGASAVVASEATGAVSEEAEMRAEDDEAVVAAKLASLPKDATAEQKADTVGTRPGGLTAPRNGAADDLKRIRGIGKVNESRLNALGIYHFDQIAAWKRPEILWVGTYLSFPGRIDREDWVGQARVLATGNDTDFSKRVDRGEVPSSGRTPGSET